MGIGIQNRDEGTVRNVVFRNLRIEGRHFGEVWWGESEPIYVTAYPRPSIKCKDGMLRFKEGMLHGEVGAVSNIKFVNIDCVCENGVFIGASDESLMENILLKNVNVHIKQCTDFQGHRYDLRPCDEMDFLMDDIYGFYQHRVTDVSYEDCKVDVDSSNTRQVKGDFGLAGV